MVRSGIVTLKGRVRFVEAQVCVLASHLSALVQDEALQLAKFVCGGSVPFPGMALVSVCLSLRQRLVYSLLAAHD